MKKLLLTAFEPFAGQQVNPTLEIVKDIRAMAFANAQLEILELPVACFDAVQLTIHRMGEFKPDIVMMLGEAGGRAGIHPERVAINMDDFNIPDNTGHQLKGKPIIDGEPVGYFSSLPINEIVDQLKQAHIPAEISNTAGLYVCNRLFYSVMHFIAKNDLPTLAGFIHVPYLHEQTLSLNVARHSPDVPWLARNVMVAGIKIAIEVCLRQDSRQ